MARLIVDCEELSNVWLWRPYADVVGLGLPTFAVVIVVPEVVWNRDEVRDDLLLKDGDAVEPALLSLEKVVEDAEATSGIDDTDVGLV